MVVIIQNTIFYICVFMKVEGVDNMKFNKIFKNAVTGLILMSMLLSLVLCAPVPTYAKSPILALGLLNNSDTPEGNQNDPAGKISDEDGLVGEENGEPEDEAKEGKKSEKNLLADEDYASERFLIKYKDNTAEKDRLDYQERLSDRISAVKRIETQTGQTFELVVMKREVKAGDFLAGLDLKNQEGAVEYIQPDYQLSLLSDDPYFANQWGLKNIQPEPDDINMNLGDDTTHMVEGFDRLPPHLRQILDRYPQLMEFAMDVSLEHLLDRLMAGDFRGDRSSELLRDLPPHILMELAHDPFFRHRGEFNDDPAGNRSAVPGYVCDADVVGAWEKSVGENVMIAVIDTGIDISHEDLAENIWINMAEIPGNDNDDDGNGYVNDIHGWNFADGNNKVFDTGNAAGEKHGTHIAGIIAAVKDNGIGIAGAAPKARIMPLKVFRNGKAYTSDIIAAIEYAKQMGARVVNASWGSTEDNRALHETIENSGLLFICAAGNSGLDIDTVPVYPAAYDGENIISVASVNRNGLLSAFSNYGISSVDVAAPGEEIFSTIPGNEYTAMSGTSMAAAFVAGEAALLLGVDNSLDAAGIKGRIMDYSDRLSSLTEKVHSGNKVNFSNALFEVYSDEVITVGGQPGSSVGPSQWDGYGLFDSSSVGLTNVKKVAAGYYHSLALKEDGTVWAWGRNDYGQLGDGTITYRAIPMPVNGLTGVKDVAGCSFSSLALKEDGTVWSWGNNSSGILGDGTTTGRTTPVQVKNLTGVVAVAARYNHCLALKADGTVWAWGANGVGQLGDGTTTGQKTPVQVSGLTGVKAIAGGTSHSMALKADETVWTWGSNSNGQLGDGTTTGRTIPGQVNGLTEIEAITGGVDYSAALKIDGTVWSWGNNNKGQLGNGTTIGRSTPGQVSQLTNVTAIAGGYDHIMAVKADETVWSWGANNQGRLGDGTVINRLIPVQTIGLTGVAGLAAGLQYSLALKNNGTVWCWGYNDYGQLGDGIALNRLTPMQISGLTGVTTIVRGNTHSLALKEDGTVWTWGSNSQGELGDGTTIDRAIPVQVSGLTGVTAIAAGELHSLALKADRTVWTWGYNWDGQLGDGTATNRTVPVQVNGLTGVKAIDGRSWYSMALKEDGTVWSWGSNSYGQLGDGTTTNKTVPVQVSGLTAVKAISTGNFHNLALKENGTVWSWGYNSYGQLGNGTKTNRTAPGQVSGQTGIKAINGGAYHSLTVKENGTVWSWGYNYYGQLGDGTMTDRTTPVQVNGLTAVTAVAGGQTHSLALKTDRTIWSWGSNYRGALGDAMRTVISLVPMGVYGNPPHITATRTDTELALSYSIIGGTVNYEVEIDGTSVNNARNTTYTYPIATPGHQPTYRVRSINQNGPGLWSVNTPSSGSIGTITNNSIQAHWQANGNPAGTLYKLGAFSADNQLVAANDWTNNLSDTLSDLSEDTPYKIKIKAKNEDGVETAWAEIGTTTSTPAKVELTIDCLAGKDYLIIPAVQDISDFTNREFTVTYTPAMLQLQDFAAQTKELDQATGVIKGTNIEVLSHADGVVRFKVNKTLPANKIWSGALTVFKFKALGGGQTTLTID